MIGNGKITRKLKELGLKINGKEPKGNTVSEVIDAIANDYTGGGGGTTYQAGTGIDITDDTISVDTDVISPKLYTHNIDLEFLDGCDETKNIIFRVISSSVSAYNATSFKALFNIGPAGQEKSCGLFNNALIETNETNLPFAFGDLCYNDEADNFRFANNVGNSNYDVSNLTLQTITDNPVEM